MRYKFIKSMLIFLGLLSNFESACNANLKVSAFDNKLADDSNFQSGKRQNPTLKIKFTCAGSGCASPRKVVRHSGLLPEVSSDYLSDPEFKKNKEFNVDRFKDLTEFEPVLVTSFPSMRRYWAFRRIRNNSDLNELIFKKLNIYKNGLFFEIENQNDDETKLKFICPGVGAESIFPDDLGNLIGTEDDFISRSAKSLSDRAVKSGYIYPGTFNVGRYSVENNTEVLYKTILYYINMYAPKGYNIEFDLNGHSRGAVTMGWALERVIGWLNSYEGREKTKKSKIYLNCVLYDPVAGPDVNNKKLVLTTLNPSVKLKLTQVISTNTGAPSKLKQWGFASSAHIPTDVADSTIVFLPLGHDVGNKSMSSAFDGKLRKTVWKYDGKLLKYGRINSLPPGVYYPNNAFRIIDTFSDEKVDKNELCLAKNWRKVVQPNGNERFAIPPIELLKLEDFDEKTLSVMQKKLLLDKNWIKNCNRKNIFLKLANASLHINKVLPEDKQLEFDSKFNLRVSKIKKLDKNTEEEYNKNKSIEEAPL